ncbi:MAG: phosphoribosylformylglycinamidine synthase, partial [Candidatus Micrarchaeota archaeon]|nr:phosphoribosylformylglycinamidine synthase [Candidatus Micrarchaeota archaeon]
VSESQERMTVAVAPAHAAAFIELAGQWGVEATDLGEFNQSGFLHVLYFNHPVALLDLEFLHHGLPKWQLKASWTPPDLQEPQIDMPSDLTATLLSMLSRPNICSKESIVRQYDHEVQGMSAIKPMCGKAGTGPSDAGVLQPFDERAWGIVVSHGICPRYSDLDPLHMAQLAVDEAVRNYIATGGEMTHWGGLDNFCWPDPVASPSNFDGEQKLAALVRTNQGLAAACKAYGLPLVSGKDSMKNDYAHGGIRISVPPTLLVSIAGRIPDVARAVSTDFKRAGDIIYCLGSTFDELGGSEYYALSNEIGQNVPRVRLEENAALYKRLHAAIARGLVASAHDCSDGGIAVALAECSIGGRLGCAVRVHSIPRSEGIRDDHALFSESAGRFIVSVHPEQSGAFESALSGSVCQRIGEVRGDGQFVIEGTQERERIAAPVSKLEEAFKRTITW